MYLTKNDIDYILQNHKLRFSWGDFLGRYFIVIGALGLIIASFVGFIRGVKHSDEFTAFKWYAIISAMFLVGLTLTLFLISRIEAERKFISIKRDGIHKDFIPHLLNDLKWTILERNTQYIIACTYMSALSWGEPRDYNL